MPNSGISITRIPILVNPAMRYGVDSSVDYGIYSDERLAGLFLEGDVAAFETLVSRYSRPLYNFAYRFLGDYDDANEISQATFVQAYGSLAKANLDQPLRPWLYRIARNKAIDLIRSRRAVTFSSLVQDDDGMSPVDLLPDSDPLAPDMIEAAETQQQLSDAIQRLPEKYREVVALRYTTDLTFREMGESLGIPENSVKTLFQRAKTQLRSMLRRVES